MPPRKRKRAAPAAPAEPSGPPSPSDNEPNVDEINPERPLRFFNTTFSTYRASPLYIGKEPLSATGLETLSRRLRDTFVGDVVRGVQVGLESDATLGRAGALERVEWRWASVGSLMDGNGDAARRRTRGGSEELGSSARELNSEDEDNEARRRKKGEKKVLCLDLDYENASFNALLLPELEENGQGRSTRAPKTPSWTWQTTDNGAGAEDQADPAAFLHLPLLLLRMPVPLRAALVDFLASTFDCRVSPLRLGTRSIVHSWESWLAESGLINRSTLSKDVALTLGFHVEPPESNFGDQTADHSLEETVQLGLKSIDVIVPADEVYRFLRAGDRTGHLAKEGGRKRGADDDLSVERQKRRRRKLAGGRDEEGWGWRSSQSDKTPAPDSVNESFDQPFTEALARYIDHHLALDMFHPGVRILRIACSGFSLSEGRVKVFSPDAHRDEDGSSAAVWGFVRDLVRKAKGREWSPDAMQLASLRSDVV
ncbi:Uu.00g055650.m01.CDS01 [Anthostomella pinea]|uniref:Uu.00g055650.m01.CDS01 n=1 Tax=Anthostomella pinea TaxID=933095 RepID=A0AAI8VXH5_9PEZI|nr:Uu.00g055650.m01.CDS01 [Anthostomella pinea]